MSSSDEAAGAEQQQRDPAQAFTDCTKRLDLLSHSDRARVLADLVTHHNKQFVPEVKSWTN